MADVSEFDFNNVENVENVENLSDNESDYERELRELMGGSVNAEPKRDKGIEADRPSWKILDNLVEDCLKDPESEEDDAGSQPESENDIDIDSKLLSELSLLSETSVRSAKDESKSEIKAKNVNSEQLRLIENRTKMYKQAETDSKEKNDLSRQRRFQRAIKLLEDFESRVKRGISIDEDQLPPEINLVAKNSKDEVDAAVEGTSQREETIEFLKKRQNEYKAAALECKRSGSLDQAREFFRISKKFDIVIEAVSNGQTIDLNELPDSPDLSFLRNSKVSSPSDQINKDEESKSLPGPASETKPATGQNKSLETELKIRLSVYKKQESNALSENNQSKARRFGRICKQFEDALKSIERKKEVDLSDLPTPPGYEPLQQMFRAHTQNAQTASVGRLQERIAETDNSLTLPERLEVLVRKQHAFKVAALNAKRGGNLNEARECLKKAKELEPLIAELRRDSASGSHVIDMTVSPDSKRNFDSEENNAECYQDQSEVMEILQRSEIQLSKQLKICLDNRDSYRSAGDINGANKFEKLAVSVTQDLDIVRLEKTKVNKQVPKMVFEQKSFSVMKRNTDIPENELELTIVRGIDYNCSNPREIDTYVKFDFPYPKESPVTDQTSVVKNTNNPEYNAVYNLPIHRNSRTCLRIFKRGVIKFDVYSKGWFFLSDNRLGSTSVKLQKLETECEIHDSLEILDGRRPTGGKLEIKVRIRNPLLTAKKEEFTEKWLSIQS